MFGYSKITSVSWMPGIWGYVQVASSKDQGFAQYDNILLVLCKCFYLAVSFSWWCMYFAAVTCFCLLDYVFLFLVGRRFVQYLLHVCHLALVFLNRTATTEVFFHFLLWQWMTDKVTYATISPLVPGTLDPRPYGPSGYHSAWEDCRFSRWRAKAQNLEEISSNLL